MVSAAQSQRAHAAAKGPIIPSQLANEKGAFPIGGLPISALTFAARAHAYCVATPA